jgi:hypothetical protein
VSDDGTMGAYAGRDTLEARIEATIRRLDLGEAERYGRTRQPSRRQPIPLEQLLAFEERWGPHADRKEAAIREAFNRSAVRYYQALNAAIDTPEAHELNPMLVNRLREQREARTKARESRTFRTTR